MLENLPELKVAEYKCLSPEMKQEILQRAADSRRLIDSCLPKSRKVEPAATRCDMTLIERQNIGGRIKISVDTED